MYRYRLVKPVAPPWLFEQPFYFNDHLLSSYSQEYSSIHWCCMKFKLCWPSPLSQYLVHFQEEVQSRNLFQGAYRKSRNHWIKAGDDFCCKINELALIWRDLDHRILSQDRVFNTEFRDRVDHKLEDLAQKSSHYFKTFKMTNSVTKWLVSLMKKF